MKSGRCLFISLLLLLISNVLLSAQHLLTTREAETKIEGLLQQMTLEEKIGQLNQVNGVSEEIKRLIREGRIGSLLNVRGAKLTNELQKIALEASRLKIPLIFGNDVIHGYRTIFPIPLGEASSWDLQLIEKTSAMAAREAAVSGTHWTFAPMVDIARDPRWGRIAEGAGEDPYLGSMIARAKVRGFQGQNLSDPFTVVACPKHYVAYGAAEAGKDYNSVDISLQTLMQVYLPPFKAAIEAGAGTLMSAFNDINGMPASANRFTLTQILREEWGFEGFVVSDWNAITELINHRIAATPAEAAQKALTAGVDMDMMGFAYINNLVDLVYTGEITEYLIDQAVRRVLRIKSQLGLFDHPYVAPELEQSVQLSKEHLALALESARKSIVLLKNDQQLLPLSKTIESIAVIGPLANSKEDPLGCWNCEGKKQDVITVLEGIRGKIASGKIHYAKGCEIDGSSTEGFTEAVNLAKKTQMTILVIGESADMTGEASSRASIDLPGVQQKLVEAIYNTGTPIIVVLMNGRPLAIPWIAEHIPAILETWFLGIQTGNAIADVLFGDYNPGGKLPVTFPRSIGQVPIYYSYKTTGRPSSDHRFTSRYLDLPVTPQFPFGYGLSYTSFEYSDLVLEKQVYALSDTIRVSVKVKNSGKRSGDEVVQLYLRDDYARVTRPVKELKGFQRITLAPGESKTVTFTLTPTDISFYDEDLGLRIEPGTFTVFVGGNSVDLLEKKFEVL